MTYEEAFELIKAGHPVKHSDITDKVTPFAKPARQIVNLFAGTDRGNAIEGKLLRRAEKLFLRHEK